MDLIAWDLTPISLCSLISLINSSFVQILLVSESFLSIFDLSKLQSTKLIRRKDAPINS